jgi:hypothetical protein
MALAVFIKFTSYAAINSMQQAHGDTSLVATSLVDPAAASPSSFPDGNEPSR